MDHSEEKRKEWRKLADRYLKTGEGGNEVAKALLEASDAIGWLELAIEEMDMDA